MLTHFPTLLCLFLAVAPWLAAQGLNTTATKDDWEEINFEFNSAILSDGYPSLLRLADLLNKNPGYKVRVEGNTDSRGPGAYNEKLGMRRAETVKAFLVKYSARPEQVETASHGKQQPKADNQSREGRFINRRVQLTVLDAQGHVVGAGGAAEAIKAMEAAGAKTEPCCGEILKKLDKLDDILAAVKQLNDANAALRKELDALKQEHNALREQVAGLPKPLTKPEVTDITRSTTAEVLEQNRMKRFSLLGLNIGGDSLNRSITFTGKGRFFAPFKDRFAFQSEGEYLYFRDRQEGQFDFGLVNRFHRSAQAGLFASFKHVSLRQMQNGGTLGQASLTLDYLFGRGRLGLFGSKGFLNEAVVNRTPIGRNIIQETFLRTIDQVGASTTLGLAGRTYLEANLGYLKSRGFADRPGGTLRFVFPVTEHIAFSVEGGINETLLTRENWGRATAGVLFGSFLRPKDYAGVDHPVPADIPRVRYEMLTRRIRTGNDAPVADAGADQIGVPAGEITLNGSGSFDPDGDPITFEWNQIAGPSVTINNPKSAIATFRAEEGRSYAFRLTVKDDKGAQAIARTTVTTQQAPDVRIVRFQANPPAIRAGQTSTIVWEVLNAETVEISGLGRVDPRSGTSTVAPNETTQYRLTARNPRSEVSETITITVERPQPTILACTAQPMTVTAGQPATLFWATQGVDRVEISGIGTVEPSGSREVRPAQTTTFTLTATNQFGSATCNVTVSVTPAQAPRILRFQATPAQITAGQTSTLLWAVENATEVSISSGVGAVEPTGTRDVQPAQTTTYTLTARNSGGEVMATATVTVTAPPPPPPAAAPTIASCTATPSVSPGPGQPVQLSFTATNATAISISGVGSVALTGPVTVRPTEDTTFIITATGASGTTPATCSVSVKVTAAPPPPPTDNPPVAKIAGGPVIETVVRQVTLDGRASTSPLGLSLTYEWTSRNTAAAILNPNSPTPTVQLGELFGDYFFDLVVRDSRGVPSTVATIVVRLVVTHVP